MNNTRSLPFGVAIFSYPLIIVPKQKRATEKPRETTVESGQWGSPQKMYVPIVTLLSAIGNAIVKGQVSFDGIH